MTFSYALFFQGFSLLLSLIIAIGIQNSFVLKQGILRSHNLIIAIICSFGDALLIIAGIYGFGELIATNESLLKFFHWGGVLFLFGYSLTSFYSAFKSNRLDLNTQPRILDLKGVVIKALIVTFFNPNAYLDTCVLIGSVTANFSSDHKLSFTLGTITASCLWFFMLSFAAPFLKPLFEKPISWKILDFMIGCLMFTIAISLIK